MLIYLYQYWKDSLCHVSLPDPLQILKGHEINPIVQNHQSRNGQGDIMC